MATLAPPTPIPLTPSPDSSDPMLTAAVLVGGALVVLCVVSVVSLYCFQYRVWGEEDEESAYAAAPAEETNVKQPAAVQQMQMILQQAQQQSQQGQQGQQRGGMGGGGAYRPQTPPVPPTHDADGFASSLTVPDASFVSTPAHTASPPMRYTLPKIASPDQESLIDNGYRFQ